jgi:small subunit ribosomal protein S8
MSVTDPIADMLTSIRNAVRSNKRWVVVPSSRVKRSLLDVLVRESFIRSYRPVGDETHPQLKVFLKYDRSNASVITDLQRVSTPGRRVYVKHDAIPRVRGGFGTAVLSTPAGVLTDKEARRQRLGGEWICTVW